MTQYIRYTAKAKLEAVYQLYSVILYSVNIIIIIMNEITKGYPSILLISIYA